MVMGCACGRHIFSGRCRDRAVFRDLEKGSDDLPGMYRNRVKL